MRGANNVTIVSIANVRVGSPIGDTQELNVGDEVVGAIVVHVE